jgi:hypothetical protein
MYTFWSQLTHLYNQHLHHGVLLLGYSFKYSEQLTHATILARNGCSFVAFGVPLAQLALLCNAVLFSQKPRFETELLIWPQLSPSKSSFLTSLSETIFGLISGHRSPLLKANVAHRQHSIFPQASMGMGRSKISVCPKFGTDDIPPSFWYSLSHLWPQLSPSKSQGFPNVASLQHSIFPKFLE